MVEGTVEVASVVPDKLEGMVRLSLKPFEVSRVNVICKARQGKGCMHRSKTKTRDIMIMCNLDYPDTFVHGPHAVIPGK